MDYNKLKHWAIHNYNVLMEGYHGTGKTASIKALFNELYGKQGEDWLYFSASTMDVWVDFVGVPREATAEDGTKYLDLVRPLALAKGTVKAIFIDEFNRGSMKTKNAVMELLQFKSINGKRFENLNVIWAAINPDEDGMYDVERLDPAQKDRFEVFVKVPYDVNKEYFFHAYKKAGESACDWWRNLEEDIQRDITPRRLEAALRMWKDGGDIADVLPEVAPIHELIVQLEDGSYIEQLKHFYLHKDIDGAKEALQNENFYTGIENEILDYSKNGDKYVSFFVPLMPPEKIVKLVNQDVRVRGWMVQQNWKDFSHIFDPIIEIYSAQTKRNDDEIAASLVSRLKFWKKESGGDEAINDNDYIDMVSDYKMNIAFFKTEETRTAMVNRMHSMLTENKGLTEIQLIKFIGPLLEMFQRKEHKASISSMISNIKHMLKEKHKIDLMTQLTIELPGLRMLKNKHALESVVNDLKIEKVI